MDVNYQGKGTVKRICLSIVLLTILAQSLLLVAGSAQQGAQPQRATETPLEVRLAASLRWENGCLSVKLDNINHSSIPIFLTEMGPYFYVALNTSKDETITGDFEWINIYWISSFKSSDAKPLQPGSSVRNEFCLTPAVWVVNLKKETRRKIPVRGKLRIEVSYFPTEEAWKREVKLWADQGAQSQNPLEPDRSGGPHWSQVVAAIPCREATCKSICTESPLGFHHEGRMVPDVYFIDPEWNARGKALTDAIALKSSVCPEDASVLQ